MGWFNDAPTCSQSYKAWLLAGEDRVAPTIDSIHEAVNCCRTQRDQARKVGRNAWWIFLGDELLQATLRIIQREAEVSNLIILSLNEVKEIISIGAQILSRHRFLNAWLLLVYKGWNHLGHLWRNKVRILHEIVQLLIQRALIFYRPNETISHFEETFIFDYETAKVLRELDWDLRIGGCNTKRKIPRKVIKVRRSANLLKRLGFVCLRLWFSSLHFGGFGGQHKRSFSSIEKNLANLDFSNRTFLNCQRSSPFNGLMHIHRVFSLAYLLSR